MAARSSDPLTAATTAILLPRLRAAGFRRKTNRIIARLNRDILQFFDLQLSRYGDNNFYVDYASLSLFRPRDYLILEPGARLKTEDGAEAALPADTHDAADSSMAFVVKMAEAQALPFFEATKTAEGLLTYLESEPLASRHHWNLEKACCAAAIGRLPLARTYALAAIELYREDGRSWCIQGIELCERLLSSIENGKVPELLQEWRDHSIAKLGLEKLL
jgi:hypothetical protein